MNGLQCVQLQLLRQKYAVNYLGFSYYYYCSIICVAAKAATKSKIGAAISFFCSPTVDVTPPSSNKMFQQGAGIEKHPRNVIAQRTSCRLGLYNRFQNRIVPDSWSRGTLLGLAGPRCFFERVSVRPSLIYIRV